MMDKIDIALEQLIRTSVMEFSHMQIYPMSTLSCTPPSNSDNSLPCSNPIHTSVQDPRRFIQYALRSVLKSKQHHILVTLPCIRQVYNELEHFRQLSLDVNK